MSAPVSENAAASPRRFVSDFAISIALEPEERWWGGSSTDGIFMPYGSGHFEQDLSETKAIDGRLGAPSNQAAPVLVSTKGRAVASKKPFSFTFCNGRLDVRGAELELLETDGNLRAAYLAACQRFFPPSGELPAKKLITAPQYCTWIEMPHRPTQDLVIEFANRILAAGMPPGTIIIDDCWSPDYGNWTLDEARFPDPVQMTTTLHDLGFSVMLWLVPFVSADSKTFRDLSKSNLLVRDSGDRVAVREWWNGHSAMLDVSNPAAVSWLTDALDHLVEEQGIDGFKFDAGDVRDYFPDDQNFMHASPVEMCQNWARIGLRYPFNEFRACWNMAGQPLGQRLADKPPMWGLLGLGSLIPEMLAQSMMGYAIVCPDMIGGGEINAMEDQSSVDQEFFVRYAQLAALSPMMQFSVLPSRVLDETHYRAVRNAVETRERMMPVILDLAQESARTGEPLIRPLAYEDASLADVTDQFMLGPDYVVAPVLEKGATARSITLPDGSWKQLGREGGPIDGRQTITVPVTLETLPVFERVR